MTTLAVADRFIVRSHRLEVEWSRRHEDVFVRNKRRLEGTDARFRISRESDRRLDEVFSQWAPEEFDFELRRTRMLVKLLRSRYVSRSEAKRLCTNLGEFREVLLDFRQVDGIGQGFADEVFRVFATAHPETALRVENANSAVRAMLRHAGVEDVSATQIASQVVSPALPESD